MGLQIIAPPAEGTEPLGLTDFRGHGRLTDDAEDTYLKDLISAAREYAETFLGRALPTQEFLFTLDSFPDQAGIIRKFATQQFSPQTYSLETFLIRGVSDIGGPLLLPRPPLQSVVSIKYTDRNGVVQTLASSAYIVDSVSEPARVTPAFNTFWPQTQPVPNAVQVDFVAGYASAQANQPAAVPASIRHALRFLVAHWYEHREAIAETPTLMEVPLGFEALLWQFRDVEFA